MSITFRDLENFVAASEARTLSEAAEKLGMAQPSLSLALKKLEKEVGYPLFVRGRDGIRPTPAARNLLSHAREAIGHLEQIRGVPRPPRLRIGCHGSVGMFVLGNFFKDIHAQKIQAQFEIVNAPSHDVNKLVARGEVDFGLVMNPLPIPGLVTRQVGEDEVRVWESKDRYQDKLIFHPQMLQANSIIARWKKAPTETIEVGHLELAAHLVQSGAGMGILPGQVVAGQRLALKVVPNTPSFKDRLALVCYPEMLQSSVGKAVFETLKGAFRAVR